MSNSKFNKVLKLRLAAVACLLVAVLVTFFMTLPNRSSKSQTEEQIITAQGATAALESRLESYRSSGLTSVEFESSVAVLDGAIPFSGTHPRCDDGSDPLGLAAASLNQNNIKFALDAAMKSAGIESDVTSYTKTEVAVTDNNSLSAYAVSVSIPTSPSQLDAVMRKLTGDGFLVTSDTVVVTAEQTTETIPVNNPDPGPQFGPNGEPIFEDQQSEVITSTAMTTSARLIFWYSSTPEFYQADALEAACSPEATEGQPEEIVEEEAFDAEVPTEEVLLSIDNEYRTLAAFGGGPVPVEEMTPVNGIDFTLSDGNLDGLLEGGDIVALNGMTLVLGTAETPGLIS